MRRAHVVLILVLALLVTAPAIAGRGTDYGEGLTGKKAIKVAKLLADPEPLVGTTVRVKGTVTGVCEKRGCWMTFAADEGHDDLRIKVDDDVIVFPLSAKGKRAIAEGTLEKIEMSLEQSISWLRHLAEERGDSFDAASVTEPLTYYRVKATGARIL